ncbi:MAG: hypothetical protein QM737_22585 [Ferruginibacter sp.]
MKFFQDHAQIHDTYYEDNFDFAAERHLNYPVSVIENIGSDVNDKFLSRTYNVTLVDRIDENIEGIEDEIYSDMEAIATDFITWVRYQMEWEYEKNINLVKVVDDGGDRVCGYSFQVTLKSIMPLKDCAIPTVNEIVS